MTESEAKKTIADYVYKAYIGRENMTRNVKAAFNVAEMALDKQIPLKPIVISACEREYECKGCENEIPDNLYDFCPWCGQAIDWSDWDE